MYNFIFAMYQEQQRNDIMWLVSVARDITQQNNLHRRIVWREEVNSEYKQKRKT